MEDMSLHPFQNGGHVPAKISSQTGRFYDKTRFKGRISNCPSGQKIENLPSLLLEGCTLPIHLPSFRSLFLRQNFHRSNDASDFISKGHGNQIINFSRRHIDHGKLSQACNAPHRLGNPGLNLLGVCDKLPKVYSHPFKGVAIPGLRSKLRSNETFLAKRKYLNLKRFATEIMFQVPTASRVASFLGLCQSTMPAILETALHIRAIQRDLIKVIAPLGPHASYKIKVTISQEAINDLQCG